MSNERRRHNRVSADLPATIVDADGRSLSGTIANFSDRGVFIRADVSPDVQRPVHVHFVIKPEHQVCKASGKVAWKGPNGIGVLFDDVNEAFEGYVRDLEAASQSVNPRPKQDVLSRLMDKADIEIT